MRLTRALVLLVVVAVIGLGLLLYGRDAKDDTMEALPRVAPRFDVSWHRNVLTIDGHSISAGHEQHLLDVARVSFPQARIESRFEALNLLPVYWHETTTRALQTLAASASGSVILRGNNLTIKSVAVDSVGWQTSLQTLQESLAGNVFVDADTISLPEVDITLLCQNAFDRFEAGAINFEESTDRLRSSAYPRLDRIAALADACRNSVVSITGHSDSTGEETQNRQLSLQRATAVAAYLENAGIDRQRLLTAGAGSSQPIANNATRYGRGLNRRIEISFATTALAQIAE